jgi:hypothetical protein
MTIKSCIRCDWEGQTVGPKCPNCGESSLYVVGAPPTKAPLARAGSSPRSSSTPSASPTQILSPTPAEGTHIPTTLSKEPPRRSVWSVVIVSVMGVVLLIAFGTWLRSFNRESPQAAPVAPADAAVPDPPATDSPTFAPGTDFRRSHRGWNTVDLGDVSLLFRLTTPGWERFGDISINKSTVGPQNAEGMIFWTSFPRGEVADPCSRVLQTSPELAAAVASAPGTELLKGPSNVTIGGHPAKQVVVVRVENSIGCDPAFFFRWDAPFVGALWTKTQRGDTIRMWILRVHGELVFIGAETHKNAGAALKQEMQRIVGSLRLI